MSKAKIGVLISGRGSNMKAIIDACLDNYISASVSVVISNKKDAAGLDLAKKYDIPTLFIDPKKYDSKESYEIALSEALETYKLDLVCLAGYMKILGKHFIEKYRGKLINIHPSLLPAFKGLDAQKQAYEYGVKIAGCTVHYVDETVDGGKIIMQDSVDVLNTDSLDDLEKNILKKEHKLYPKAIKWVIENMKREE